MVLTGYKEYLNYSNTAQAAANSVTACSRLAGVSLATLCSSKSLSVPASSGVISPSLTALVMALIDWPIPNIFPFTHSSHVAILTDNNRWNIRNWAHYDMVSQQTAFRPKLAPDLNP